ncbi:MAG: transposase [Deltaproteobacteria bacterium]|nr:transposase [Deltaproteobacteria bacterium]
MKRLYRQGYFRVSNALKKPYEEVRDKVVNEEQLNVDESGWPERGKKLWVWLFCSASIALFAIRNSRGTKFLKRFLGKHSMERLPVTFIAPMSVMPT